jgi:hypothetical protein
VRWDRCMVISSWNPEFNFNPFGFPIHIFLIYLKVPIFERKQSRITIDPIPKFELKNAQSWSHEVPIWKRSYLCSIVKLYYQMLRNIITYAICMCFKYVFLKRIFREFVIVGLSLKMFLSFTDIRTQKYSKYIYILEAEPQETQLHSR